MEAHQTAAQEAQVRMVPGAPAVRPEAEAEDRSAVAEAVRVHTHAETMQQDSSREASLLLLDLVACPASAD